MHFELTWRRTAVFEQKLWSYRHGVTFSGSTGGRGGSLAVTCGRHVAVPPTISLASCTECRLCFFARLLSPSTLIIRFSLSACCDFNREKQVDVSLEEFLAFQEVLQHLPEMEVRGLVHLKNDKLGGSVGLLSRFLNRRSDGARKRNNRVAEHTLRIGVIEGVLSRLWGGSLSCEFLILFTYEMTGRSFRVWKLEESVACAYIEDALIASKISALNNLLSPAR